VLTKVSSSFTSVLDEISLPFDVPLLALIGLWVGYRRLRGRRLSVRTRRLLKEALLYVIEKLDESKG